MKNPKLIYDVKKALHTIACSTAENELREFHPELQDAEIRRIMHIARKDFQLIIADEIERRWFTEGGKKSKKTLLKELQQEERYRHIESEDWDHIAKGIE